ncbi:MAG: hypothetical protein COB36_10640 [Alphaproteobacteria bacterium]|nr:MAG: hypothetical protein COB36_10640 [Alphaproteobacteria bacterium]
MKGTINASPEVKALRNVGRIKTLRLNIAKRKSRGMDVASREEELSRRLAEVQALKDALAELDD